MTPEIKKKWDALKYRMEKESYLLILLELRFASLEHAITMSFGHQEVAMALGLSDRYIRLMKQIRDTTEGTIEDYALSMLEYVYEENGGDKRNFTHFRMFDTDALDRWWKNKRREEELDVREICKESLIADFKHDYWRKFKTDIQITELETEEMRDPEEPQETKTDEDEDDTKEMIAHINRQEAQDEIVCRMYKDGAISEDTALKYTGGDLTHESLLKLVEIYAGEEETEPEETPEQAQARADMAEAMRGWVADERREARLELLFELVQDGVINIGNAFEYVPSDYGLDFDAFLRMQEAWEEERADE